MISHIRRWKELERWLPGSVASWEASFSLVPLGELLRIRREQVKVSEFAECTAITIHFDGSIVPRDRKEPFKGCMFAAYPGDLVYSKIDVRNGALGLVPAGISKAVVTSEYPVHVPDSQQVDAHYLGLLLRSPNFQHLLKGLASGTSGRKRVHSESIEALEVPLPELPEQRRLLAEHEEALSRAAELEREATKLEQDGLRDFEAALGLMPSPHLLRRTLQIARFKDLERWSHEGILDRYHLAASNKPTERFPLVTLGDVVADLKNGWSPKCLDRPAHENEWGVLRVGAVSFGEFNQAENKALPVRLRPKPWLEVKPGDVLISRANVLRLVGACAIVRETRPRLLICDKIFRVEFERDSQILPEFLAEILKTPSVRQQIESGATGTSPTMKNISKPSLLDLSFPIPLGPKGLQEQESLVRALRDARDRAAMRTEEKERLRAAARSNLLAAIFQ